MPVRSTSRPFTPHGSGFLCGAERWRGCAWRRTSRRNARAGQDGPSISGNVALDYIEGHVNASIAPAEGASVGFAAFYSPEFTGETGGAYCVEANGSCAFTDNTSVSGAVGYQTIDDVSGVFAGEFSDEYATWNLGGSYAVHGFTLDLRYVGGVGAGLSGILLSPVDQSRKTMRT
jgi:hypothetical protein